MCSYFTALYDGVDVHITAFTLDNRRKVISVCSLQFGAIHRIHCNMLYFLFFASFPPMIALRLFSQIQHIKRFKVKGFVWRVCMRLLLLLHHHLQHTFFIQRSSVDVAYFVCSCACYVFSLPYLHGLVWELFLFRTDFGVSNRTIHNIVFHYEH